MEPHETTITIGSYKSRSRVDGPHGWLITVASMFAHALIFGVMWSPGIFYDVFREIFDSSSGILSPLSSAATACSYGLGPLAGMLVKRYGHRPVAIVGSCLAGTGLVLSAFATEIYQLVITFGIITGVGLGISYIAIFSIIPVYCVRLRSVAAGVAASGMGLGVFVYPVMIRACARNYGPKASLLITGALTFNLCVCGAVMRPLVARKLSRGNRVSKDEVNEITDEDSYIKTNASRQSSQHRTKLWKSLNPQLCCNLLVIALCINSFVGCLGIAIVYTHITAHAEEFLNITKDKAAILVSAIGIGSLIGRPIFGLIPKVPHVNALLLFSVTHELAGLTILFIPWMNTFSGLLAMASLFGFFTASISTLLAEIIPKFVGVALFPNVYGFYIGSAAVATLIGPALAGYMYDEKGTYEGSFYFGGTTIVLSGIVMLIPYVCGKRNS